ncbi:MAG: hypothetical protein JXR64_05395 [Spirochaetales bacterium]|nr:hypothetical protein [Spirochaetales bacterium]
MQTTIKNYYDLEVSKIKAPPLPTIITKKTIRPWENILLASIAIFSMVIVYMPGSYNSRIRNLTISPNNRETIKKDITRVFQQIDLYYSEKGDLND